MSNCYENAHLKTILTGVYARRGEERYNVARPRRRAEQRAGGGCSPPRLLLARFQAAPQGLQQSRWVGCCVHFEHKNDNNMKKIVGPI